LFIAALWSAPEREPILRSLLNGVMTDIGAVRFDFTALDAVLGVWFKIGGG
jgi:hypothetical protein